MNGTINMDDPGGEASWSLDVSPGERQRVTRMDRAQLQSQQFQRLNQLLTTVLPHNSFYARKLAAVRLPITSLQELEAWPVTTKDELVAAEEPLGGAANRTWPLDHYVRFHRTSVTHGKPLVVLDTAADWKWWLAGWQYVLDAAGTTANDRVVMAFSFGPFIGFWTAFDAVVQRGSLAIPTGGMSTRARLELIASCQATQVMCTPSYALHLADQAQQMGLDLRVLPVKKVVVAGEPGGSLPAVRSRLESLWGAAVIDHAGATEVGPWGFASPRGLYVNESQFIAEFLQPDSLQPAAPGEIAELVLTTLGRTGCPVIRYRTGDLVQPQMSSSSSGFTELVGGVLGRADDMIIVRGV
ncbi:MAG: phenylacetate--CoA ligase family protein, partial [Planctomycetota bacterium]